MNLLKNCLYIVSTPIGNLEDITLRAIKVLKNSDIILCEYTRRSIKLLNHFKIKKKLISFHKFNEKKQLSKVIEYINQGKTLSLVSDAGTPLLSDPGINLINECINNQIKIIPIPGPSSITTAMSISGFKDHFLFYGFLPKKDNEVDKILKLLSSLAFSQVFFVPAIKLNFYIKKFQSFYSGRKILIAKELTKLHETFYREDINNLKMIKLPIKGELTIVISEKASIKNKIINKDEIVIKARKFLKKYTLKDTVSLISEIEKINKKVIYKICLKIKNEKNN